MFIYFIRSNEKKYFKKSLLTNKLKENGNWTPQKRNINKKITQRIRDKRRKKTKISKNYYNSYNLLKKCCSSVPKEENSKCTMATYQFYLISLCLTALLSISNAEVVQFNPCDDNPGTFLFFFLPLPICFHFSGVVSHSLSLLFYVIFIRHRQQGDIDDAKWDFLRCKIYSRLFMCYLRVCVRCIFIKLFPNAFDFIMHSVS